MVVDEAACQMFPRRMPVMRSGIVRDGRNEAHARHREFRPTRLADRDVPQNPKEARVRLADIREVPDVIRSIVVFGVSRNSGEKIGIVMQRGYLQLRSLDPPAQHVLCKIVQTGSKRVTQSL